MTAGRRLRAFFQEESSESKSSGIELTWQSDLMRKRKKSDEVTKQCTKNDMVISIARPLLNKHSSLKMKEKCNSAHMSDLDLAPPY